MSPILLWSGFFRRNGSRRRERRGILAVSAADKIWVASLAGAVRIIAAKPIPHHLMYFGVCYHPEHWVYPYDGTEDAPESRWAEDAKLMAKAGYNVVRMGEYVWGSCEPEEGRFDFAWLRRVMDLMQEQNIKVVLATPTAAPPLWLAQKHPEILPRDEQGLVLHEGTRHACCVNSDTYWNYSRTIVTEMAKALGDHPQLIAWQIDSGIGGHTTEFSFNEETKRDWHGWLRQKYETVDRLNEMMGTRFWSQIVTEFSEVPMPMRAPTVHNPALVLDWMRFSSDTIIAFIRMQAQILRELTPKLPVTTIMRALTRHYDHFDMAEAIDFASLDSNATIKSQSAENAMEIDILRSLKKENIRMPGEGLGAWVMEQKAGNVNWQPVNSLVRPGVVRLFTYQLISRGIDGILYFFWRQPRIGSENYYGGVLGHKGTPDNRIYREISQVGEELKLLAPVLQGTRVRPEACILVSHDSMWSQRLPMQPNSHFNQRDHILRYYKALHDRNIPVDFAHPCEDLSHYKVVFAPSLQLIAGGETDLLKLYVQNGGTLVGTFNTGLYDEHHIAPGTGLPSELTDLFGMEVVEFDPIPPGEDNNLLFKGSFPTSHLHPAQLWCDIIEPKQNCKVMARYGQDFYAGKPAMTMNEYGLGRAIYIGTMSHQHFYFDLIAWLRQICNLHSLLKVPDTVEVSMRERDGERIFFLLNHQTTPIRIHFYKPMHDFLTGTMFEGKYDLPPHGVLILDEHPEKKRFPISETEPPVVNPQTTGPSPMAGG